MAFRYPTPFRLAKVRAASQESALVAERKLRVSAQRVVRTVLSLPVRRLTIPGGPYEVLLCQLPQSLRSSFTVVSDSATQAL
jgi:hypothetical protein